MRIVLHAGLHKSGTTAVQAAWREAYGEPGSVWYPSRPGWRQPGHHLLVWPLLAAYVNEEAPDLVLARRRRRGREEASLADVIAEAEARGVRDLVISTEELDRVQPVDVPGLQAAVAGKQVTALLTVTRPTHRWCSGWQELVKHGLSDYPAEAAAHIQKFAALQLGRLDEIVRLLPATWAVVRLVRADPHEPQLAREAASLVGLPDTDQLQTPTVRNRSLGADIEIVRRVNQADAGLGTMQPAAKELLKRVRDRGLDYVEVPGLEERYRLPDSLLEAAEAELEFLRADHPSVVVHDPHGLLRTWTDMEVPAWYREISRREAVVPELEHAQDPREQLWRLRQERAVLQAKLARADRKRPDGPA